MTMDVEQLQNAAIGIAIRNIFSGIENNELEVYENLADEETEDYGGDIYVWEPFEDYNKEQIREIVEDLKDDIYHTMSELL